MKLSIKQVSYRAKTSALLDDVNLEIESGARTAVIGPNGAGKSTLLRVAAGDLAPISGAILYGDTELSKLNVSQRARSRSVLSQQQPTDVHFTAEQVISMGRYPYRFDRTNDAETDRAAIESAIGLLDLTGLRHRQVRSLSGGEQQRVAMARVLVQQAPIVLLDEPTTALDIRHQESVMALLESLSTRGHSVLVVLHDLNLVSHFDNVVLLHQGRIVGSGVPRDVLTTELLTDVYGHHIDVVEHPTREGILMIPQPAPLPGA
jgi:iron complex transport system ATP-binding protein